MVTDPTTYLAKSKDESITSSTCDPIISTHSLGDFIDHIITRFSQWSGVSVGYISDMLELSGDRIDQLDVIEDCLRAFGRLEAEPDEYPWKIIPDRNSMFSTNFSIILECNMMLNEIDEIRERTKGGMYYEN
jgi:hypothetical protein